MEFKKNQIVQLRNGIYGVVATFNDKPFQLIFRSYTNPINRYNDDLKNKNKDYDVVKIFDGSSIEDVTIVFSAKFSANNLPLIWEGNDE
jgi:hypothetical protein